MTTEQKDNYVRNAKILAILKNENNIKRLFLGMVTNNCELVLTNYLVHAFNDIESYTDKQERTLIHLINRLNYGK